MKWTKFSYNSRQLGFISRFLEFVSKKEGKTFLLTQKTHFNTMSPNIMEIVSIKPKLSSEKSPKA